MTDIPLAVPLAFPSAASHRRREALPGGKWTLVVQRGRQSEPQAQQLQLWDGESQDRGPKQVEKEAPEPERRSGG